MSKPLFSIKPDGTVETDDIDAALEFQRRARSRGTVRDTGKFLDQHPPRATSSKFDHRVVKALKKVDHDRSVESGTLASHLGLNGGRALGPFSRRVKRVLEPTKLAFESVVSIERGDDGKTNWKAGSKLSEAIQALEKGAS